MTHFTNPLFVNSYKNESTTTMTTFTTQDRQDAERTPLTDVDIKNILDSVKFEDMVTADDLFYMFARAIEAAHGIGE